MKTIRASEVGVYLYCHRAWWYERQGIQTENTAELASGTELHERHGQAVIASSCLQTIAYLLLLVAIMFLTIYLVNKFI